MLPPFFMPCWTPVTLYMSRRINEKTGRRSLVSINEGFRDKPVEVACGRCEGCKLERSRQWAIRIMHENQMHEESVFLTLTYRDEELKYGKNEFGILVPDDLQRFWKRLRKRVKRRIRYFACGEYGDKSHRPHYHAVVFGVDFKDKEFTRTENGNHLYYSRTLDDIWTHGNCIIGSVSFESAAYVARYIMKKRLGWMSQYYEAEGITPEFVVMSRRPGIGAEWYDKYERDIFPRDRVSIREGIKGRPPKYYFQKFEKTHPLDAETIRENRKNYAIDNWRERRPERMKVKYRVAKARTKLLIRNLD